jgi:hypothetical protein
MLILGTVRLILQAAKQSVLSFLVIAFLKEVEQQQDSSRGDADLPTKRRILLRIQQSLIAAQEVGDEKLQIVQTIQDLIENKARQLDHDYRNLGERFHFVFQKKSDKAVEMLGLCEVCG